MATSLVDAFEREWIVKWSDVTASTPHQVTATAEPVIRGTTRLYPVITSPQPETRDPAETLRLAAAVIREHGWRSGVFRDSRGGHCAVGAIAQVCGIKHTPGGIEYDYTDRDFIAAVDLFSMRVLGWHFSPWDGLDRITDWNDDAGKTKVLQALDPR